MAQEVETIMRIVLLTGAGISAESGLGTFRDEGGLWAQHDLADVATPEAFMRDPNLVHRFYNARRQNAAEAQPNAAHRALTKLQTEHSDSVIIVTQNVDDLHERAGSEGVIHMHGELTGALCAACGERWSAPAQMNPDDPCPSCNKPTTRPDIVWFGEMPLQMDEIHDLAEQSALFVSIGTSGEVYPAAGFVTMFKDMRKPTVELNLEPSRNQDQFNFSIHKPATVAVEEFKNLLIKNLCF